MLPSRSPRQLLQYVVGVLCKRKILATVVTSLTLFAIVFGVYMIEPKYRATAKILVRANPQQQLILFHDLEWPKQPNQQILPARNLIQISKSRAIAEQVVRKFELDEPAPLEEPRDYIKHWGKEFVKSPKTLAVSLGLMEDRPKNEFSEAIDELIENVQDIHLQQDTEIVDLTIWASNPDQASGIANEMADLLVEKTRSITQSHAREAYHFAEQQVTVAEESLGRAEEKYNDFKRRNGITSIEEQRRLLLARIDELSQLRSMVLADLAESQAKTGEHERQLAGEPETLVSTSVEVANPLIRSASESTTSLEANRAAMRVALSENHPDVRELGAQIDEVQRLIADEVAMIPDSRTTVINPVHQDLEIKLADQEAAVVALRAKASALEAEIASLEDSASRLAEQESALERLRREMETHQERFKTLKSKLLELEVLQLAQDGDLDIRVVDPAVVMEDTDPHFPDWELVLMLGLPLALTLGVGSPFVAEYFNDRLDGPEDVAHNVSIPLLGVAPWDRRLARRTPGRRSS